MPHATRHTHRHHRDDLIFVTVTCTTGRGLDHGYRPEYCEIAGGACNSDLGALDAPRQVPAGSTRQSVIGLSAPSTTPRGRAWS